MNSATENFINRARGLHKYKPNVIVNTRYLSTVIRSLPESGLVGLASDMGTGKTEILAMIRLEFGEVSQDKFAQLVIAAPDWEEWMA